MIDSCHPDYIYAGHTALISVSIIPSALPEQLAFSASFSPAIYPVWAAFDPDIVFSAPPL